MKYNVQIEEWKKTISKEIEVIIPENPVYYFQTGIRRAYAIIPVWSKWMKEQYNKEEEIVALNIVTVDPTNRQINAIQIWVSELNNIMRDSKHFLHNIIENVLLTPEENKRTEEQFSIDFNNTLNEITIKLKGDAYD